MGKLFDELAELKAAYDKKLCDEGEAALKEAFKEFFDKHPNVASIYWSQYTPYFNDGDACNFGVREFEVDLQEVEGEEPDEDEDDYPEGLTSWDFKRATDDATKQLGADLDELEGSIPADVLEHVFGDHVRVTATPGAFEVREYNHD